MIVAVAAVSSQEQEKLNAFHVRRLIASHRMNGAGSGHYNGYQSALGAHARTSVRERRSGHVDGGEGGRERGHLGDADNDARKYKTLRSCQPHVHLIELCC